MIEIACKKTKFTYNAYHITKAFFPDEEIVQKVDEKQESLVELKLPGGSCFSLAPGDIAGEPAQDIGYRMRRAFTALRRTRHRRRSAR